MNRSHAKPCPTILCAVAALLIHAFVVAESMAAQFQMVAQTIQFSESAFDKSNFDQMSLSAAKKKCEDSLLASLALVEKAAVLSKAQRSKLELAGQIDIHRFFASYAAAKRNMKFGPIARKEWQTQSTAAQTKIRPLTERYSTGLHGKNSLFAKTLVTTLDSDQYESVDSLFRERALAAYSIHIRRTLSLIDRKVPLTRAQRTTIMELLLTRTEPPESYGMSTMKLLKVLGKMGEIENELRDVFSDQEWRVIAQLIQISSAPLP